MEHLAAHTNERTDLDPCCGPQTTQSARESDHGTCARGCSKDSLHCGKSSGDNVGWVGIADIFRRRSGLPGESRTPGFTEMLTLHRPTGWILYYDTEEYKS